MAPTTEQQILIEQRVANDAKSTGAAYLLFIFFGAFGVHRFYLGYTGTGLIQLLLFVGGWMTLVAGVGAIALLVLGLWVLADLFLIPGMVASQKDAMRRRLLDDATFAAVPAGASGT